MASQAEIGKHLDLSQQAVSKLLLSGVLVPRKLGETLSIVDSALPISAIFARSQLGDAPAIPTRQTLCSSMGGLPARRRSPRNERTSTPMATSSKWNARKAYSLKPPGLRVMPG